VTTDPTPHLFWITSRAAGTAALVLASVGVLLGLLMGTGLLRGRGLEARSAHEAVSLATLAAIAVHGLALLGDGFIGLGPVDIAVPFASGYHRFWTGAGIVAGWSLALLGLSYYARARIGQARWRRLHRFTALAWVLGIVHAIGEGTDSGQAWFLAMIGIVTVPAALLLVWRLAGSPRPGTARKGRAPAAAGLG
jgi:sulfoxide reductase heme-binding subunit YedZ